MNRTIKIAAIMLLLFSCKKDNESDPTGGQTRTALLTAASWKLTSSMVNPAYDVNGNGIPVTDMYASMPACSKDDRYTFNPNGDITYDEGASKCNPSDPQTHTDGKWKFLGQETMLDLDGETYQIAELTTSRLMLKRTWTENATSYSEIHSFSHN